MSVKVALIGARSRSFGPAVIADLLLSAMQKLGRKRKIAAVNVPVRGAISNLSDDTGVEVPAWRDGREMQATRMGTMLVDGHAHLFSMHEIPGVLRVMDGAGLSALAICCMPTNRAFRCDVNLNAAALLAKAMRPRSVYVFAGLDYTGRKGEEPDGKDLLRQARALVAIGADGFKMLEGKPNVGRELGVRLDAPCYDDFYGWCEAEGIPIVLHVADPEENWLPATDPFLAERGWSYADGAYPSKEELYRQAFRVFGRFPRLKVQLAHFFFLSADRRQAHEVLERFPSVTFDVTPGDEMYRNFAVDPDGWRGFFLSHRRRVVLGTDNTIGEYCRDNVAEAGRFAEKNVARGIEIIGLLRAFWETRGKGPGNQSGLALPPEVLEHLYAKNFLSRAGEAPRPLDIPGIVEHCLRMRASIGDDPNRRHVAREIDEIAQRLRAIGE